MRVQPNGSVMPAGGEDATHSLLHPNIMATCGPV